ncbi:hypothetical protein JTE90_028866 [Oedothorax gibbosus]|uniref:Exonuclease domain-containing protein n=1 Tax=Oedothorax gibbosus TaxID=931172 RepID=A0AAV6U934_9ARAC|nr:hypothetical protein JTE90_028866 [Oedothorax gibbosus]
MILQRVYVFENGASLSNTATPNPKRKNNRKDRKKRVRIEREKPKEEEEEPRSRAHSQRLMEELPEFTELNMPKRNVYHGVSSFVLTHRELVRNDYPLDTKERPGRVQTRSSLPKHQTRRRCARCKHSFQIIDNKYHCETECIHHLPVKPSPVTGRFTCCNGNQWSEGCFVSPFHVTAEHCLEDVVFSRIRNKRHVKAEDAYGVYGLDCEMSYTTAGLEVTKICLVGVDGITIYDTHVKPDNEILDYNTDYSGVTAEDMTKATTTLADVQAYLLKTLHKDSILVGHALHNDLKALRIIHDRVVDTSVLYPHSDNPRLKFSLKTLAKDVLHRNIQVDQHDCIEDARTCLALVLRKVTLDNCCIPVVPSQDENRNGYLLNHSGPIAHQAEMLHCMHQGEMMFVPYNCRVETAWGYPQTGYWNIFYPR